VVLINDLEGLVHNCMYKKRWICNFSEYGHGVATTQPLKDRTCQV
jgi:hypothetical protein